MRLITILLLFAPLIARAQVPIVAPTEVREHDFVEIPTSPPADVSVSWLIAQPWDLKYGVYDGGTVLAFAANAPAGSDIVAFLWWTNFEKKTQGNQRIVIRVLGEPTPNPNPGPGPGPNPPLPPLPAFEDLWQLESKAANALNNVAPSRAGAVSISQVYVDLAAAARNGSFGDATKPITNDNWVQIANYSQPRMINAVGQQAAAWRPVLNTLQALVKATYTTGITPAGYADRMLCLASALRRVQ